MEKHLNGWDDTLREPETRVQSYDPTNQRDLRFMWMQISPEIGIEKRLKIGTLPAQDMVMSSRTWDAPFCGNHNCKVR